jgi:hypothetical protein
MGSEWAKRRTMKGLDAVGRGSKGDWELARFSLNR